MTAEDLGVGDYPLARKRPERVRGARGKRLEDLTLDSVLSGESDIEDTRITRQALMDQAQIARAAGRTMLAANFERAAEMTAIPQDIVMEIYELLRPGRVREAAPLLEWADRLRRDHGAEAMAGFLEEAAEVYQRRGLFTFRY